MRTISRTACEQSQAVLYTYCSLGYPKYKPETTFYRFNGVRIINIRVTKKKNSMKVLFFFLRNLSVARTRARSLNFLIQVPATVPFYF